MTQPARSSSVPCFLFPFLPPYVTFTRTNERTLNERTYTDTAALVYSYHINLYKASKEQNLVRHRNLLLIPSPLCFPLCFPLFKNFDHDVDSALQFLHLPNERQGWIYIHQGPRADDQHPEEHPHPIAQLPVGRHHARAGDVRLTP
jgi:hypothetical protein